MAVALSRGCVTIQIGDLSDWSPVGWAPGPHPFPLENGEVASTEQRRHYFRERAAQVLYGTSDRPNRWNRQANGNVAGFSVDAAELLTPPALGGGSRSGTAFLVLHGNLGDDPAGRLAMVRSVLRSDERVVLDLAEKMGLTVAPRERPTVDTLAYVAFDEPMDPVMSEAYASWPVERQWLWLLASATAERDYPPDPFDPELFESEIALSASWRVLVLRSGAAFVATRSVHEDPFLAKKASTYVSTLYLDTLLLGLLQKSLLDELSDQVVSASLGEPVVSAVRRVNQDLLQFRSTLWSQQVTNAGHANRILVAYHRQHRLPELLEASAGGVSDLVAGLQEASNLRSSSALGLIALVGFPLSLALTAVQVLGWTGWAALGWALVTGAGGASALIATRVGHELLSPLLRLRQGTSGRARRHAAR